MDQEKGCGCGCNGEHDHEEENFITLQFDDGADIECEILGVFEVEGKEYIALVPDDGSDDVFLYGYKEIDEEEFEILDIDDDAEFAKVAAEFEKFSMEDILNTEE